MARVAARARDAQQERIRNMYAHMHTFNSFCDVACGWSHTHAHNNFPLASAESNTYIVPKSQAREQQPHAENHAAPRAREKVSSRASVLHRSALALHVRLACACKLVCVKMRGVQRTHTTNNSSSSSTRHEQRTHTVNALTFSHESQHNLHTFCAVRHMHATRLEIMRSCPR